jgi:hypothetical protein
LVGSPAAEDWYADLRPAADLAGSSHLR